MTRSGEQVNRIEPVLERRACALKRRPGAGVYVPAAKFAGVGRTLRQPIVLSGLRALGIQAFTDASEAQVHEVIQAGIVTRKLGEKLRDSELCHGSLLRRKELYQQRLRVSRGYIPIFL